MECHNSKLKSNNVINTLLGTPIRSKASMKPNFGRPCSSNSYPSNMHFR